MISFKRLLSIRWHLMTFQYLFLYRTSPTVTIFINSSSTDIKKSVKKL